MFVIDNHLSPAILFESYDFEGIEALAEKIYVQAKQVLLDSECKEIMTTIR